MLMSSTASLMHLALALLNALDHVSGWVMHRVMGWLHWKVCDSRYLKYSVSDSTSHKIAAGIQPMVPRQQLVFWVRFLLKPTFHSQQQ